MSGVTIIAGNGVYPRLVAEGARRQGIVVSMVSLAGEASHETEKTADRFERVRVGRIGGMLRCLRRFGNREVVFAGGVNKVGLLSGARPDLGTIGFLTKNLDQKDDSLLRALARHFEENGFSVVAGTVFCPELIAPKGPLTKRRPTSAERADAEYGLRVLAALSPFSTGQSVIVKGGNVISIEAAEGTDSSIARVRALGIRGATLSKTSKSGQDPRFDIPAVGPATVAACARAGIRAIFMGAGASMLLGVEETVSAANREGISITGL